MDPLSLASGCITAVQCASKSCSLLYQLLSGFLNAPVEIKDYTKQFEALAANLQRLIALWKDHRADLLPDVLFLGQLEALLTQVTRYRDEINEMNLRLSAQLHSRTRARLRWAASYQRKVDKFSTSILLWNGMVVTELLRCQTQFSLRISNQLHTNTLKAIIPTPKPMTSQAIVSWQADRHSKQTYFNSYRQNPRGVFIYRYTRCFMSIFVAVQLLRTQRLVRSTTTGSRSHANDTTDHDMMFILDIFGSRNTRFALTVGIHPCFNYVRLYGLVVRATTRGDAPIRQAVRTNDFCRLQTILKDNECLLHSVTPRGDSLLHLAVSTNNEETVNFLLQQGAYVNHRNDKGNTPLHLATVNGVSTQIVRFLLEAGADLDASNLCGRSPLHTFFNETTKSIIISEPYLDIDSVDDRNMSILHYIAWSNISMPGGREAQHLKQSQHILRRDYLGRSMLHLAVQRGNLGMVQDFCSSPYAEDLCQPDLLGQTPMHYAVESGRAVETIDLLLKHGLAPNARDLQRRTPIHQAALHNNVAALKALLSTPARRDAFSEDLECQTPVALAQMAQSHDAVQVLMMNRCGPPKSRGGRQRVRQLTLGHLLIWKLLLLAWQHKSMVVLACYVLLMHAIG